jgi:hypothetical protein
MNEASGQREHRNEVRISPVAGCLISLSVGVVTVASLVLVAQLTLRGDMFVGRGTPNETRLWLIQEGGNQGLGLSRTRARTSSVTDAHSSETSIRFIPWRSDGAYPPITTCNCPSTEGEVQTQGLCPP